MADWTVNSLARMIDHSLLHPTLDDRQLVEGLAVAVDRNCISVCLKPCHVALSARLLDGTGIATGTVVGFPHGGNTTQIKIDEARRAVDEGASEIDMVVNIGRARSGEWGYVRDEIGAIDSCITTSGAILKVIFETDYLTDEMIEKLCIVCNEIRPAYIKTSTGYGFSKLESGDYNYNGATARHVAMMRKFALPEIGIKAAGKIRTLDELLLLRSLGATRFGLSATELILDEATKRLEQQEV